MLLYFTEKKEIDIRRLLDIYSAKRLICAVFEKLGQYGPFVIADCVSKTNAPSVRTHISCGFRIVSENGINRLSGMVNDRAYGMEYVYAV